MVASRFAAIVLLGSLLLLLMAGMDNAGATLKYKKETGKKCTFCHTEIPEPGDKDPRLTEDGKKYKENGHKLTEEQKQKPD